MSRRRTAYENNRRLLRNAHAKLRRLESKGINTEGLLPSRNTNSFNGLVGWNRRLASFNSRSNQYVAGENGAPIPLSDYKRLRDAENKYIKRAYNSFKRDFSRPLYTASGRKLDMTVGEDKLFNSPYPSRGMSEFVQNRPSSVKEYREVYPRLDIKQVKSVADLNKKISMLNSKEQKKLHDKRLAHFRENVIDNARIHNDLLLVAEMNRMTKQQLMFAFEQTDFIDIWKKAYYPVPGVEDDNHNGDMEYLYNILDLARKQVPAGDQAKRNSSIDSYRAMDIEELSDVVNKRNSIPDDSDSVSVAMMGYMGIGAMGVISASNVGSYDDNVAKGKALLEEEEKKQRGELYRTEREVRANRLDNSGKVVIPSTKVKLPSAYDESVNKGKELNDYAHNESNNISLLQNGNGGSVTRSYNDALQMYMLDIEILTDGNVDNYISQLPKKNGKIVVPDFYLTHSDKEIIARRDKMLERKYGK